MLALILATAINTHATVTLRAPENFEPSVSQNELALEFVLKPEWHIYWENPGDSGEEPRASWTLPEGVTAGPLIYPTPHRIPAGPFTNFGYDSGPSGQKRIPVVFRVPLTLSPKAFEQALRAGSGGKVDLSLKLTYLVCKEECVPEEASLKISVPVGGRAETSESKFTALNFDESQFPKSQGLGSKTEPHRLKYRELQSDELRFEIPPSFNVKDFEFFPLTTPLLVASDKGRTISEFSPEGLSQFDVSLETSVMKENRADTVVGLLVDRSKSRPAEWVEFTKDQPFDFFGLLGTLGFAVLGGLLLNLMPCVFPVVSLKVLSFVREGQGSPKEIRRHAYAYTLGILTSLWALVAVLLIIRSLGSAVGWGFQLQNPIFLFALLAVFFILGLNLLGVFEINTTGPLKLQNLMMKQGLSGSFFTGLLTTVVATPCSAPFMGVAIGAALASGPWQAILVFTALGLGLSLPYFFLALNPALLSRLPKPGVWMIRLKEILAFPLFLTAVWLFWVLSQTVNVASLTVILIWLVSAGYFVWSLRDRRSHPWIFSSGVVVILAMSFATLFTLSSATQSSNVSADEGGWSEYSEAKLQSELDLGKTVFVDFTASWCVTCQINKKLVLSTEATRELFAKQKIVTIRADWTKRDTEITNALSRLGRNSVPVYALYRPSSKPKLLPEILTFDILKQALEE